MSYIHLYTFTFIHIYYKHVCVYIYIYIYMYIYNMYIIYVQMCICIYIYIYMYLIHLCMIIRTRIWTHLKTHAIVSNTVQNSSPFKYDTRTNSLMSHYVDQDPQSNPARQQHLWIKRYRLEQVSTPKEQLVKTCVDSQPRQYYNFAASSLIVAYVWLTLYARWSANLVGS